MSYVKLINGQAFELMTPYNGEQDYKPLCFEEKPEYNTATEYLKVKFLDREDCVIAAYEIVQYTQEELDEISRLTEIEE